MKVGFIQLQGATRKVEIVDETVSGKWVINWNGKELRVSKDRVKDIKNEG
jgi:hypothetical protein